MVHSVKKNELMKGFAPLPHGTRWKAKFLVGAGQDLCQAHGKFPGCRTGFWWIDSLDLEEFGFPGKVIHTPGHTYGSMVVLMEGGELFAGDTLFGIQGKQHFPPFAEDLPCPGSQLGQIRTLTVKTIYPAHGRHFSRKVFWMSMTGQ